MLSTLSILLSKPFVSTLRSRDEAVWSTFFSRGLVVLVPDLELRVMNEVMQTGGWPEMMGSCCAGPLAALHNARQAMYLCLNTCSV